MNAPAGLSDLAFRRLCRRLHALGPRPFEELTLEVAITMQRQLLEERLSVYCSRLDRDTLAALDANAPLHLVGS